MNNDIFSIRNFSVIEDDENYYFFRALEPYDLTDQENGKITKTNAGYDKLRTYRERYNETHSILSRYKEDDQISLDEVYSHIKKNFYPGTNCISFSTNCNVSLDYGYGFDKYVMIEVPKTGVPNVYSGGQYMIEELDKYLENVISKIINQNEIISIIRELEQVDSNEKVIQIIKEQINNYSYIENGENLISRFLPKQFFNSQQQLAYNKIIGKLTLLELSGNVDSVLSRTNGNKSLISTISMAYSSGEIINYGNEFPSEIKMVSKTSIDLFALLQQAEDMGLDKNKVDKLKRRVLDCAKQGFELRQYNETLGYGNDVKYIPFTPSLNSILLIEDKIPLNKEILIDDTFRLTDGRIPYTKAKSAVNFALNLALSKEKTYELCELLKTISSDLNVNDIIDEIASSCYSVNGKIINRRNMSGLKVCESVNIDMNPTREKIYSNEEQIRMLSYIGRMSRDNLRNLLWSSGLSIEKNLCQNILSFDSKRGINRYYAETIVQQVDFSIIYGVDRIVTNEEKELLISKLEEADCVNLYSCLKKCELTDELIGGYVINFLMDDGFKEYNFIELSKVNNLEELLKVNIGNINFKISAIRLDKIFGISDNANYVEGTSINLRDYQQDAIDNIENIFEEKRFAGVVLPTGAGKSFVAMAEMLKYKNKNILYYAPNTEILNQITKHILKNVLHLSGEEIQKLYDEKSSIQSGKFLPSNIEVIINQAFPHLKLYCYQGLTGKDDDFFDSHDADLIVFDEIHRAGATEWNNKIKKLVKSNPKAKLLGITATPVRDVDRQDMMLKFAELSGDYSKTELIQKRYLASEMYLIDAMQDGIVVVPNLVSFDYTLEGSDQYKEIKSMYENEKDLDEKLRLKEIYDEMRAIVENAQKKGMPAIIKEAFEKNGKRTNGRYIVFLPIKSDSGISTEQYVQKEIEKVKEYFSLVDENPEIGYLLSNRENSAENSVAMSNFERESEHLKLIFAINMLNEGVHVDGIDGIVMLRPIGASTKILYSQQTGRCVYALDPNNPVKDQEIPLIFDVYNNYLEQNMDREVNKSNSTSDLQKMRLAVYWVRKHKGYFPDINSENTIEYRKAMTFKKLQMKYLKYLDDFFGDNLTPTEQYEIEEILMLGRTVNLWDRIIPNRENINVNEKSVERINTFKATGETKRFLELCKKVKENSNSNVKVGSLRIRTAISILELLSEYGININNDTIPINSILEDIIEVIPSDLLTIVKEEMEGLQISNDYPIGVEYNFVKQMFCTNQPTFLEFSIRSLRSAGIFHEFTNEKGKILCSVDSRGFIVKGRPEYRKVNIYTSSYYDIDGLDIDGYDELYFKSGDGPYNKYGFDRDGIHIKTKTRLNKYGFDVYGNYQSLQLDGSYENKGKYDDYGFDIDGLWFKERKNRKTGKVERVYTGKKIDHEGYNIDGINEDNFGRNGFYYIKDESGEYINTGLKVNDYGFDKDGIHENGTKYDNYGFDMFGVHLNGTQRDDYGFDRDGFAKLYSNRYSSNPSKYINGFDRDGVSSDTGFSYNSRGFDRDGYYWKLLDDGTREKTEEKYNENGFDINKLHKITKKEFNENGRDELGYRLPILPKGFYDRDGIYWEKEADGTYKKTVSIFDKYGFDQGGLNRNGTKYDDYGFDKNGYYKGTKSKYDNGSYGFDRDGVYWEIIDLKKVKIDSLIDKYQFDRDGYYWEELEDGSFKKTNSKYDLRGFDKFRIHKVTGQDFDEFGMKINGKMSKFWVNNSFFDEDGFYFSRQADGRLVKTNSKYNDRGFDRDGFHKDTKLLWDEFGLDMKGTLSSITHAKFFDKNGFFWRQLENGTCIKTDSRYNERGFNQRGLNKDTLLNIDIYGRDENGSTKLLDLSQGFDEHGVYWIKQDDGTYKRTGNSFNENQFDKKGFYWEKLEDGSFRNTYREVDNFGFDKNGECTIELVDSSSKKNSKVLHVKSKRDKRGFDKDGNHGNGTRYDARGFDRNGIHQNGTKYDENGWSLDNLYKNGTMYNEDGFDYNGIHKDTHKLFDKNGNNVHHEFIGFEYDNFGFDINGINKNGTKYDVRGFDVNGIRQDGSMYDEYGFDRNGINYETHTILSSRRFDCNGHFHKSNNENEKCCQYSPKGFDQDGYYWKLLEDGTREKTEQKFNEYGFDEYGRYWELQLDGTYIITDKKYSQDGIDMYGFNQDGIFVETGLEYDRNFFRADGINIYTDKEFDRQNFDRNGICQFTGTYCTNSGFDQNGIHCVTGTRYDEYNRDIFRNPPFDLVKSSNLPYEVYITKKFFEEMLKKSRKEFYILIAKRYRLKTAKECSDKLDNLLYIGVQMCPELKNILCKQLGSLGFEVAFKRRELKKIDSSIKTNQEKIAKLEQQIKTYENIITKYSAYK